MRKFTTPIQTVQQLAINIHDVRKAAGLSQEELANKTGLSRSWINRLENGKTTNPGFNDILSIYKALGISNTIAYQALDLEDEKITPTAKSKNNNSETQFTHDTINAPRHRHQNNSIANHSVDDIETSKSVLKNFKLSEDKQKILNAFLETLSQRAEETERQAQQLDNQI
ncbi:helix-turn-helix transcriptional regulator [Bifidobacterium sp. ESL0769]|uniref:helix-turn-helix domain-containing protein n=1 Tax=Bifidobacterium sp. ESL0769 TaxID=2983229 RepID=UPI0023F96E36|nr:helix-turn-helix transcriptional regulator [Bifidobacterium sp. ESL0769]WEV67618.1 helix-turn-helix transcriptional regulator [Bifidobacterium sp. ESL0769]